MFDSLFGELVSVAILLGLGFWLLQNRHVILKLVGAIFALLALAQALSSPALLTLVGILARPRAVETGAAFWHMVDLVWVLLFPVVYLL